MYKKYVIIVVCIATIAAVMGVNMRMDATSLQTALDYASATSQQMQDDVALIDIFFTAVGQFDVNANIQIMNARNDDGSTSDLVYIKTVYNDDGTINADKSTNRTWTVGNSTADQAESALQMLEWGNSNYNGAFEEVVNAINGVFFILGAVLCLLLIALMLLFDTAGTVLSLVRGVFYLIGL